MMKLIKKYFLYVADAPVLKGIITGTILFISMVVIITTFFFNSGWTVLNLSANALTISAYVILLLSTINFVVVKIFITSLTTLDDKIVVIVNGTGKIERYQKPIWGRYPYCIIELPKGWTAPLSKRVHSVEIEMKVRVNKLISKLKFRTYFSFTGELNDSELAVLLQSQTNCWAIHHVELKECVKSLIENYNNHTGNNDVVEIIISDWLDSTRDRNDLIEKINGIVSFPNNLFDNMKIEILLEKVEIQLACVLG